MQTELWTAYEAAAATGGALCARGALATDQEVFPEENWAANGLSIDTRTIRPGDMFVAVKDQRDGHDFVSNAFQAGASVALVSHVPENLPDGVPLLLVKDTMQGLSALAEVARDRCFGKLIAVTGSAGKTSTKEILRDILGQSGNVHAADKSFNNHLGVPLTLAQLPAESDFGVFEIGMNHAGEITPLTQLVRPHIAIITTVAPAHLEFFNSVEEIAEAKAEIFAGLRPSGVAILPIDNEYCPLLKQRAQQAGVEKILSYGRHEQADYRLCSYEVTSKGTAQINAKIHNEDISFTLGITGEHQALNALAALAAADVAGADRLNSVKGLSRSAAVSGRGERTELTFGTRKITLIDESYNANPASMNASIAALAAAQSTGRKIAVLGEMKELGQRAVQLHRALAAPLIEAQIDQVYCAGEMMRELINELPISMQGGWAETASDLTSQIIDHLEDNDTIMAKGSNASKVFIFVEKLKAASCAEK